MAMELINHGKSVKVFCKVLSKCAPLAFYYVCISFPAACNAEEDVKLLINSLLVYVEIYHSGGRETGWEALAVKWVRDNN